MDFNVLSTAQRHLGTNKRRRKSEHMQQLPKTVLQYIYVYTVLATPKSKSPLSQMHSDVTSHPHPSMCGWSSKN